MSVAWDPLATRARGLTAHLLGAEQIGRLERAGDARGVQRVLQETAYGPFLPSRDTTPTSLDRAVTRCVAHHLGVLARWAGPDHRLLLPLFLEEDARSVRALVRGAGGALGSDRRLAATSPTPTLRARALETLAGASSVGAIAATLTAWGHPLGPPLLAEAGRARPDAFRLELALARAFAETASEFARRLGDRDVRDFVRDAIAGGNLVRALLLVGTGAESPAGTFFVEGAEPPRREDFARATAAATREACLETLGKAMAGSVLAPALSTRPSTPVALSRAILDERVRRLGRERRERPLSAVPVLVFALRLRREAAAVRRAVWASSFPTGSTP